MKELCVPASLEKLNEVMGFLEETLDELGCSMKVSMQIQVAAEEIFVNIVSYAYPDREDGMACMQIGMSEDGESVEITFIDSGIPFDPLAKPDPDVTLSAEERAIGGLGIFMVKKTMDQMKYVYEEGKNQLTMIKKIL